jgi:hypothetical protein
LDGKHGNITSGHHLTDGTGKHQNILRVEEREKGIGNSMDAMLAIKAKKTV